MVAGKIFGIFVKKYMSLERQYRKCLMADIESTVSSDPSVFWDNIKSVGPQRYQKFPDAMSDRETNQFVDKGDILHVW